MNISKNRIKTLMNIYKKATQNKCQKKAFVVRSFSFAVLLLLFLDNSEKFMLCILETISVAMMIL
jgi:hypothetical protein